MELPPVIDNVIVKGIDFVYSFVPLAEQTVILVPAFVNTSVSSLADTIGFDVETLQMTLGMFLCYPLGLIMKMLPYGKMKHLFSFLLGVFLLQFTIGKQWIHHVITTLVCYAIFLIVPIHHAKKIVPVFIMVYVTLGHFHRQYMNYLGWDMDFTGSQMVLTMKLYSLAYNLYDGKVLAEGTADKASKKCAPYAVDKLPGIIEYLGYTFCFANVLAGPAYEYKSYSTACDGSKLFDKNGKPLGKIPSCVYPTLKAFFISLLCLVTFVVGNGKFPLLDPNDPQVNLPMVLKPEFLTNPWLKRYLYAWVSLFFVRQKYYFAWKNAEGANNIWYAGFEGFDSEGKPLSWENSNNVDIFEFETASNVKSLTAAWNKKTANWLGRYVYIRTGGSLLLTYGLSAFWHGLYPGYYMFFMSVPILTACERLGRKKISPYFSSKKWSPYGIFSIFCTQFLVEYLVLSFQLLSFEWAYACWKSHYFFGHIVFVLFFLIVSRLPTPKKKSA